jgi:predicted ATPase/serine phosphatase RsbU (regulator of sigma subunit)
VSHAVAGYTLPDIVREAQGSLLLRGTRDEDGARVIVKLVRGEHPTAAQIARLRHEHALLASLDLPEVVRPLALTPHGRGVALILEDLGDVSLESKFRHERPTIRQFLEIAIRMAGALGAVHRRAVIHKDIKPHHFLLIGDQIKLVDFGIATRLSNETQIATSTSALTGTLAYMSPEQTGRMNRSLDRRTDLYSLGVSFYQILTGRLPFEASDPLELVHAHIARAARPVVEVAPHVPRQISDIVRKLMAKGAEDRYQSAAGLEADLRTCLAQVEAGGDVAAFTLGRSDVSSELSIPQKLYGREAESAKLLAAFQRARRGGSGLFLISGPSGVGKSALVSELQKQVVRGGAFAGGRFDPASRAIPVSALVTACRGLIRALLAEPPAALEAWTLRLREALGRNGKLIADLVPELELVVGPQSPVPPVGAAESQARFELVFTQFVQAFARPEHPLVLFLDDLQWADAASLRLVRQLLAGGRSPNLLIVGAHRDDAADELQPVRALREELGKAGVPIDEVVLGPLGPDDVTALLAEALRLEAAEVRPLAAVLLRKTAGNPFFLQQFLTALVDQGALAFDATRGPCGQWAWDEARVEAEVASENVVDLLVARLRRLSDRAQEALALGAAIGHEWTLGMLSQVAGRAGSQLGAGIWEALREGVLVPLDASYRFLSGGPEVRETKPGETEADSDELGDARESRFRFLHDRVHQAAYELRAPAERGPLHARIGRLLLAESREGATPSGERLFEIVRQLNLGEASIGDEDERRRLARLNLEAARRVAEAGSHATAVDFARRCLSLLGPNAWSAAHAAAHEANLVAAESEFLNGNLAGAFARLDTLEANAESTLERVAGRQVRIGILTNVGRLLEAVDCGVETARLLGATVPATDAELGPAIGAELGALKGLLAGRTIESLVDLPEMQDPERRALAAVLFKTNASAFLAKPQMSVLFGLKAVRLAIEHGNAPTSPYFYANYGIINYAVGGELDVSYRFGRLGIDLVARGGYAEIEGSTHFLFGSFNCHWRRPLAESLAHLQHAVTACLETGAYVHLAWAALIHFYYRYYQGESIPQLLADLPKTAELLHKAEAKAALLLLKILEQTLKAHAGLTNDPASMDDAGCDEATFVEAAKTIRAVHVYYHVLKLDLVFQKGDYPRALEVAEATLPLIPGMFFITEHAIDRTLARTALLAEATPEARVAGLATVRAEAEAFRLWAEASPANHAHRQALVAAELAALEGDQSGAIDLYDRAIALAREAGFVQHEALANERAAAFHLRKQRVAVARAYAQEAWHGYQRWGARHKLRALVERHGELGGGERGVREASAPDRSQTDSGTTTTYLSHGLDLVTAVRATQALAGELELGALLERLMRVLMENAGAQKGVLVLNHPDPTLDLRLGVEALVTVDPHRIALGMQQPLETSTDLAASVVQYVARSKETVVLGNAASDARFARDPYIEARRPLSLLCLAMQHQGRLVGVLYLENNAATDAFSGERVEILQLVAAQAAVAVENAKLYGELRAATDQLRRTNDTLEAQVVERTEALRRTLADLWSEMDLARKIQTVLLPSETRFSDYEVAAMMVPASTVGGDYYDIIRTQGSDWVMIGDVSGHGVTAGLSMMMIQTAIRTVVLGGGEGALKLTPSEVLSKVNTAVRANLQKVNEDHYMTITGLKLEGSRVRYAGLHQDILIYRAGRGTVERVETRGMWIGPLDDIAPLLRDDTLELTRGDIVLLYTDGITEAMVGGRRFGTDGLAAAFSQLAANGHGGDAILKGIMQNVEGITQQDDVTMMAVRYLPQAA